MWFYGFHVTTQTAHIIQPQCHKTCCAFLPLILLSQVQDNVQVLLNAKKAAIPPPPPHCSPIQSRHSNANVNKHLKCHTENHLKLYTQNHTQVPPRISTSPSLQILPKQQHTTINMTKNDQRYKLLCVVWEEEFGQ